MSVVSTRLAPLKLSICIATFNRARFIGETLESILLQATDRCEVIVLDGASSDDTEKVVSKWAESFSLLRYVRQQTNGGIDRDYDRAVEVACGQFCWLMADDDVMKPGAVAAVLNALNRDVSLLVINAEVRDFGMSHVIQNRLLNFDSDRAYESRDMDRLFSEVGGLLTYIGAVVINRSVWLTRDRPRYYGSLFIHVGVIFQEPLPKGAMVLAEPFISYRMNNTHSYSSNEIEAIFIKWPQVVGSLSLSNSAKRAIHGVRPWRSFGLLLRYRALGMFSLTEYRQLIRPNLRSSPDMFLPFLVAQLPGMLVNTIFVIYCSVTRHRYRGVWSAALVLQDLRESRFYFRKWQAAKRGS
jgi:glycosyltransferase involved in cell wall biosynthesis